MLRSIILSFILFIFIGSSNSQLDKTSGFNEDRFSHKIEVLVVEVYDGDTILIQEKDQKTHKVRLLGIDAPELMQSYGQEAKITLSKKIYGERIIILFNGRDKFKRVLGKIIFEDKDINLWQIENGSAWHYRNIDNQQNEEDNALYQKAENQARDKKNGLWGKENAVAPWEFRRRYLY